MLSGFSRILLEWQNYKKFTSLPDKEREIVFYSEGAGYWIYFEPVINHLTQVCRQSLVYLTSERGDPILTSPPEGVSSYYIGEGIIRTLLFTGLKARLMVMTMPDLETFHIKRAQGVHYAYIHHSLVSSHMIYREEAFDHFDSVFCSGLHHVEEIRKREEQAGLKPKLLIEHGYGKLDSILSDLDKAEADYSGTTEPYTILIAPTWGKEALFERHGPSFIGPLLDAGFRVIVRPHPQTRRFHPKIIRDMMERYQHFENFSFDGDMSSKRSFLEADLMVSDWSGAALEFAFARLKPVLFIDVPRKVLNQDYSSLGIEPFEVSIREKIGRVVSEEQIMSLPAIISSLREADGISDENIRDTRGRSVYHIGDSGKVGADALIEILNKGV